VETKANYGIQEAPLTPEDIQVIKKGIHETPRVLLKVAIILSLVGLCIVYFLDMDPLFIIVFLVSSWIITAVTFFTVSLGYSKVIGRGKKIVLSGVVQDRYEKYRNNDNESIKEYFFVVAEKELKMDRSIYQKYHRGDAIELHYVSLNSSLKILVVKDRLLNEPNNIK
jgi:hypothetical protein